MHTHLLWLQALTVSSPQGTILVLAVARTASLRHPSPAAALHHRRLRSTVYYIILRVRVATSYCRNLLVYC